MSRLADIIKPKTTGPALMSDTTPTPIQPVPPVFTGFKEDVPETSPFLSFTLNGDGQVKLVTEGAHLGTLDVTKCENGYCVKLDIQFP